MLLIDKCTIVFDIFVHIHMVRVFMDNMRYFLHRK